MIQACAIRLCSVSTVGQVRNMSAQPDQIIRSSYNSLVQQHFGLKVSEKSYRLSRAYNKYQTPQLIIRIHILLYSYMCVCVHKSEASDTQAESSLSSRP